MHRGEVDLGSTLVKAAVGIALLTLTMMPCGSATFGTDPETVVSWTFAVYMCVDNDLEDDWESASLPSLLRIPENPDVNIVVMVDGIETDGVKLLEISSGNYRLVRSYPELNFGDGAVFSWFITEVTGLYPSEKLSVTVSDHGSGWKMFSTDETDEDEIRLPEMKTAIENAGVFIDILSFDACLMGSIEVVYEACTTNLVQYIVAAEEMIPLEGFPYDKMLTSAALNPAMTPAQVAADMVEGFGDHYDETTFMSVNMAAIDVMSIGASSATLQTWCSLMHANLDSYKMIYKESLMDSYVAFGTNEYVDMADLGDTLLSDERFSDPALRAATANMVGAIDASVIALYANPDVPDSRGLTLYWARKGEWNYYGQAYAELQFAIDIGWLSFLDDVNEKGLWGNPN